MSEKRFVLIEDDLEPLILDNKETMSVNEVVDVLNEQQATINKLRKILAEAEDTIETRLAEYYLKEYENIKHNIIGDDDE